MTYLTFGQDHIHEVNGEIFDKDCVAAIPSSSRTDGRAKAFEFFGARWSFEYFNEEIDKVNVDRWFPRGIIEVPQD